MVFGRRYRTIEKIGAGGMAEVYKAVDETLGRTVAVKVLRSAFASDENFVDRFRREAQSAANLSHPGIVNIYDWGNDGGTYYIVMEYVRGTDLKSLIRQKGRLEPLQAAEYAEQVCAALSVAHGYDIIHRDIKPQNIVLMPDGRVRVMDFGIVRMGDGDDLTQTGSVLGTAQYVSPEQAQGRPLTPASDLYSLGVVLYELVCGQPPFTADSPVAVALKQVHDMPESPRHVDPDIPPALEAVIMRALAKDPRERFDSADEMRRELRRVIEGGAPSPSSLPGAGASDTTTVIPQVSQERPQSRSESAIRQQPRRRARIWPWALAIALLALIGVGGAWALGLFGPQTVAVPDLTGMTVEQAATTLSGNGLQIGEVRREFSKAATDTVIGQSKPSGARVEKSTKIDVTVSKGIEIVKVPDVKGKLENDAYNLLKQAGFDLPPVQRKYDPKVAKGYVIGTTPPAGSKLKRGAQVVLIVSEGIETKPVPDVSSKTSAEAKSLLESAGFTVKIDEQYSDTVAKGRVISQNPDGGVVVQTGTEVTIVVSKGKDEVIVPDLVPATKLTEADARAKLEALGLGVLVNETVDAANVGKVVNQNPAAGTVLKHGDIVTIYVGVAGP